MPGKAKQLMPFPFGGPTLVVGRDCIGSARSDADIHAVVRSVPSTRRRVRKLWHSATVDSTSHRCRCTYTEVPWKAVLASCQKEAKAGCKESRKEGNDGGGASIRHGAAQKITAMRAAVDHQRSAGWMKVQQEIRHVIREGCAGLGLTQTKVRRILSERRTPLPRCRKATFGTLRSFRLARITLFLTTHLARLQASC